MSNKFSIPQEVLLSKIYLINDQKVMLDSDLADLYQIETKRLNEQVKRNIKRFPEDFMIRLNKEEWENLKSQFATPRWGGRRSLPLAFTEQGIAMLSSVLNSEVAIQVNIQIIRTFTKMREMLNKHKDLIDELERIKQELGAHSKDIDLIFRYLKQLEASKKLELEQKNRKPIGYRRKENEK